MTFTGWLSKQRHRDDPVGDLARDVRRDPTWPRRAQTLRTFERYLDNRDACLGAMKALKRAWSEYQHTRHLFAGTEEVARGARR